MQKEIRVNTVEKRILEYYQSMGYEVIRRGWPDFCFINGDDIQFVEVKRKNQTNIKPHQQRVRDLFRKLGLSYKVAFDLLENGAPNFREYHDLHQHSLKGKTRRKAIKQIKLFKKRVLQPTDRVTI